MRKKTLPSLLSLVFFSSLALTAEGRTKNKSKSPPKTKNEVAGTYQIETAVKGLSVVKNGILAGAPGQDLTGHVGMNEIVVSAPNYASRKIRFWIKAGEKKTVNIAMSELTEPKVLEWKTNFKRFDPSILDKKASLCEGYVKKAATREFCDRKTFLEDIVYADDSLFRQDDLRDFQGSGDLAEYRRLITRINNPESTAGIEDLLSKHPRQLAAFHLASAHSLLRGDCPRVFSLYTELSQFKTHFHPIDFHMAVCAEAQNDKKLRDKILSESLKDKRSLESVAYWAGLNVIESAPAKASEYGLLCLKSKANDGRCNDLMNMVYKLTGKQAKSNGSEFEEAIFKNFMKIEDRLPKGGQESLFFETTGLIEQYPLAIENYLTLAWINTVYAKELADDDYSELRIRVSSIKAGSTLDKIIESIEKAELTQLLPPVYKRRLDFAPSDPNLWYRLIRSYSKADHCQPLLKAFEDGSNYLPKFNPSLLQMRGSCEVELKRFPEAITTYKKVMEVNPKIWSSPYNLANAYERAGKNTEAYSFYKKTLELNPPDDVKQNIQARIKFLAPAGKP